MPRKPRSFSNSGYMHLIIRGVGKQVIFEDQKDYAYFLKILERFSQEADISILAYCLMENHVHLLVFDPQGHTSFMMKKLEVSYAYFFNQKYKRVGHLFQNRFLNENINSEESLLRVFRYILNNPVKAGICPAHAYRNNVYGNLYKIQIYAPYG